MTDSGAPVPVAKYGLEPVARLIKSPGWGLGGADPGLLAGG